MNQKIVILFFLFIFSPFVFADSPNDHLLFEPSIINRVETPKSLPELKDLIKKASQNQEVITLREGQHKIQASHSSVNKVLLDMRSMNQVLSFDAEDGFVEVEAGITLIEIEEYLQSKHLSKWTAWGLRQKAMGMDRLSLGEMVALNFHGHALGQRPIISDIESFVLIDAKGEEVFCSRDENQELFRLVIGGHGLFGVVASLKLRLGARQKVIRSVREIQTAQIDQSIRDSLQEGFRDGDFRFFLDPTQEDFMRRGILTLYRTVEVQRPLAKAIEDLTERDWRYYYELMHRDPSKAYQYYQMFHKTTNSRVDWTDEHPANVYYDYDHREIDHKTQADVPGFEKRIELLVPREQLLAFLEKVRTYLLSNQAKVIDGTIRFIQKDTESFLAWATSDMAALTLSLHFDQTNKPIREVQKIFRELLNFAITHQGSYALGYHRFANKIQMQAVYPQFYDFLEKKKYYDPDEVFQGAWYRYYRNLYLR